MTNFNEMPMNGTNGLRETAKTFGLTNVKKYSKAQLVDTLEAIEAERAELAEAAKMAAETIAKMEAKAAKAPKKDSTKCTVCQTRKPMTSTQRNAEGIGRDYADMCEPCYTESGHENAHSDENHGDDTEGRKAEGCWICFPELNRASRPAKVSVGTSRLGMVMNVSVRAAGEIKAGQVIAKVEATGAKTKVEAPKKEDLVLLTISTATETITIGWTKSGACLYERISIVAKSGKVTKARNVAAVLRHLGVIA